MKSKLESLFSIYDESATVIPNSVNSELFEVQTKNHGIYHVCAKELTFGGRDNLEYEQRIQIKGASNNYIEEKILEGEKGLLLGILTDDNDESVLCTFKVKHSNAKNTISKQIKNETISKAMLDGFAQQLKGSEYACAFRKELLYFYLGNTDWIHDDTLKNYNEHAEIVSVDELDEYEISNDKVKGGLNKIFYGAPGCGKSRYVKDMLTDAHGMEENIIRVTFHPEYANVDFVGQILPTVESKLDEDTGKKKDVVKYIFNPGPFTLALLRAYNSSDMVYLVIEEINRGNAAAIFGDLFQLLDRERDETKDNYTASEYPICNVNIQRYLMEADDNGIYRVSDESIRENLNGGIYIPSNLTILATMNSSDQNVFTLDTAFKRRWSFEQISNDIEKDVKHAYKGWFVPGTDVTWETFLTKLNDKILENKIHNQTNEDKRLGKYFVTKDCLTETVVAVTDEGVRNTALQFAYKVLEYIWNDVCKIGREEWFDTEKNRTLEDLITSFVEADIENGESPLDVFQNINFGA